MIATTLGELRANVGGRRDAANNQQRRSGASGREKPALLAARTGRVLPARLPLCVAGFMTRSGLRRRGTRTTLSAGSELVGEGLAVLVATPLAVDVGAFGHPFLAFKPP